MIEMDGEGGGGGGGGGLVSLFWPVLVIIQDGAYAPIRRALSPFLFFLSFFLFLSADSLFLRRIKNNRKTTMALR